MSQFFILTILAQGRGGDDTVWVQLLVIVVLAAGIGVYSLVRNKTHKHQDQEDHTSYPGRVGGQRQWRWKIQPLHKDTEQVKATVGAPLPKPQKAESAAVRVRKQQTFGFATESKAGDLQSGMEILELGFLLQIVEDTSGDDVNDVTMRRLCFDEILRRDKLNRVSSKALKIYAKDEQGFYGSQIQCESLKQLSQRTKALQQASIKKVAKGA